MTEKGFTHVEIYHFGGNNRIAQQYFPLNGQLCPTVQSLERLKWEPEDNIDMPGEFLAGYLRWEKYLKFVILYFPEIGHGNVVVQFYNGLVLKERMIHLPPGVLDQVISQI
jgi:hypothetical protein